MISRDVAQDLSDGTISSRAPAAIAHLIARRRPVDREHAGYSNGKLTRQSIVDAAVELFGEVGFHAASLREIAARAGISHPGLLHYFPSKAALMEEVLLQRDETDLELMESAHEQGLEPYEMLLHLAERNAERPTVVELFTVLAAEATTVTHPAHAYFRDRYRIVANELEVDAGGSRRLRPGVDARFAARALAAMMDGLQVQWLYSRDDPNVPEVDMAADFRAFVDLLFEEVPRGEAG